MIIIKDLTVERERPKKKIFENINLSLKPGNIYILRGKNGSGKTTLLKAMLNLIEPTHGLIYWKGKLLKKNLFPAFILKVSSNCFSSVIIPVVDLTTAL